MSFRLSGLNGCALSALMALAALGLATAQGAPPGDKIQFSEPANPTVTSNLNRLDPRQSTFKQVEEDLFKPFKLGDPESAAERPTPFPTPPQMAPVVPDKRTQDLIEKRKNWAFANWNDLYPDSSMEESSNDGLDGQGKKTVSLMEKYYESLNMKNSTATNRLNSARRFSQDFAGTNTFDPSGESFTTEGQFNKLMKHILNPEQRGWNEIKVLLTSSTSAIRPPTAEEMQEQKKRIEEFQRLLDPPPGGNAGRPIWFRRAGADSGQQPHQPVQFLTAASESDQPVDGSD